LLGDQESEKGVGKESFRADAHEQKLGDKRGKNAAKQNKMRLREKKDAEKWVKIIDRERNFPDGSNNKLNWKEQGYKRTGWVNHKRAKIAGFMEREENRKKEARGGDVEPSTEEQNLY